MDNVFFFRKDGYDKSKIKIIDIKFHKIYIFTEKYLEERGVSYFPILETASQNLLWTAKPNHLNRG